MTSPFSTLDEENNTLSININSLIGNQVINLNNVSPISNLSTYSRNKNCIVCLEYKNTVYKICSTCNDNYLCQNCITKLTHDNVFKCSLCRQKIVHLKKNNYLQNGLIFLKFMLYPIAYLVFLICNIAYILNIYSKSANEYEFTKSINSLLNLNNFLIIIVFSDCILYFINIILLALLIQYILPRSSSNQHSAFSINLDTYGIIKFKKICFFLNVLGLTIFYLIPNFKTKLTFYLTYYICKNLCFLLILFIVSYYNFVYFAYLNLKKTYGYKIIYKIYDKHQNIINY